MVGAHRDDLLQALAHLLGRAVDAAQIDAGRVAVDLGEPAQQHRARHLGALVDRDENALRDREGAGVAAAFFQCLLQDRHRGGEIGDARTARPHPDRQVRPLHRLRRHRLTLEVVEAALVGDLLLAPQCPDHREFLLEARDARLRRHLELAVMVLAADADPEDRPAAANIIEAGPLMRHHQGAVDLQYDDRCAEADFRRDGRRIGQDDDRIEAEYVVERILGDPQIAKAERLGPRRHGPHRRHVYRVGRAMRQRHAERDLVLQRHAPGPFTQPRQLPPPRPSPACGGGSTPSAPYRPPPPQAGEGWGGGRPDAYTFSINSIWAPSGASMKATWRPLLTCSSMTWAPLLRNLAIALA